MQRQILIAVVVLTVAAVGLLAVRTVMVRPYGPPPNPASEQQVDATRQRLLEAVRSEAWANRIRSIEARVKGNGIQVVVMTDLTSEERALAEEIAETAMGNFGTGSVEVRSKDGAELATLHGMAIP